jgi:peptidoglycan/LPS O-acetylase OafA/YrhL
MGIAHRTEIDGLRALAVLPVIFFHAGFTLFSGGYVGVDVFFVISGFLITSILLTEHENRTFSLAAFYERRARRILPALLLMLACTLPFAYALLSPLDLRAYAKNLLAANIFIGNVVSYQQTDYFDAASEIKPLLHLWSLAIEEQYYLVLPPLLALLVKRGRRTLFLVLGLLCAASLIYSERTISVNERAAFFFTHSRVWELLLGSLAAALLHYSVVTRPNTSDRPATSWAWVPAMAGLLMVVVPVVSYSKNTPFPGWHASIPALGTALILLFAQGTAVSRLLSLKPLVAVGLVSYSAYLWHQPVFAFARYRSPDNLPNTTMVALIALTLVLAGLSWYFVEQPVRDRRRWSRRQLWVLVGIPTLLLSAAAIYLYQAKGLPERFDPRYTEAFFPKQFQEVGFCKFKPLHGAQSIQGCDFGDPQGATQVWLVGDSHASSLLGGLHENFKKQGVRGVRVRVTGCAHQIPGMISAAVTDEKIETAQQCMDSYQALSKLIEAHADSVVVSIRWTARFAPIAGEVEDFFFDNQEGGLELKPNVLNFAPTDSGQWSTEAEPKKKALHRYLKAFANSEKKVILVYPVPEAGWDVPRYNFARYLKTGEVPAQISTSYPLFQRRNSFVIRALDDFAAANVQRARPASYFCNTAQMDRCMVQDNHKPFYHDTNHLSLTGAQALTEDITRMVQR